MDKVTRISVNGTDVKEPESPVHVTRIEDNHNGIEDGNFCATDSSESDSDSNSSDSASNPHYNFYHSKTYVKEALTHLFLPKRLPDCAQNALADIEEWMLHLCSDVFYDLQFPKLEKLGKMLETWKSTQAKSPLDQDRFVHRFCYEVRNMEVGETIPVYVRQQNSTMLITRIEKGFTRVETFRSSLPSEIVMSSVGTIHATFPETSDVVHNTDLMSSETFARQLHELAVERFEVSLHTSEKADKEFFDHREVPEPFLVSDWAVGVLVPAAHHTSEKTTIVKKVRDEINCKRSAQALPFRRSGMWMSIKVSLLLKLLRLVGNDAKIIYKLILLRILAEACKQYSDTCKNLSIDLASQLLGKLGRRVKKLQKMSCGKNSEYAKDIVALWSSTLKYVSSIVALIHSRMHHSWTDARANNDKQNVELVTRSAELLKEDLLHQIPWLDAYISDANSKKELSKKVQFTNFTAENLAASLQLQRSRTLESIMSHYKLFSRNGGKDDNHDGYSSAQERIWLEDTETFVKFKLNDTPEVTPKAIFDLLSLYVKHALPKYTRNDDPVGCGQVILVVLKLLQHLDKIATKKFPLLKQYNSGIPSDLFEILLLPHSGDLKLLDDILEYFNDRDRVAYHIGILDSNEIHQNSFAVRYAQENEIMFELHKKIYADTEDRIAEKFQEVERVRLKCKEVQRSIKKKKSCSDCDYNADHEGLKTKLCSECSELEDKLTTLRTSVPVYERPLPEEEHFQHAVIFELSLPPEFSYLRESLALLKFCLLSQPLFRGQQKRRSSHNFPVKWSEYKHLDQYQEKTTKKGEETTVSLSSTRLPTSSTHHTRIKNPDILSSEVGNNDFIVSNGLDCVYRFKSRLLETCPNSRRMCTFQLSTTANVQDSAYENLQWALDSANHSQNRIIAEYTTSFLPELISFGSLRAGHRIQLMNLFRGIAQRELALEKEPVVALIFQALWQVGPCDKQGVRESHLDFLEDTGFALEFLEVLDKLLDSNDTNYTNPNILLTVVVIAMRIIELNKDEDLRRRCYQLMRKSRQYVKTWWDMTDAEISKSISSSSAYTDDSSSVKTMNANQLLITICSAFSYNISGPEMFSCVIRDRDDLVHWMQTLSRIHQLTEEAQCHQDLSQFGRILLRLATNVPCRLDVEGRLTSAEENLIVRSLHEFSCANWNTASEWEKKEDDQNHQLCWKPNESSSNVVFGEYFESDGHSHLLMFDLLLGTFLVNGYPQSGLSSEIRHHPLYELYFRGSKLRVQGYHPRCVRTIDKFHGNHYEFVTFSITNKVKIREIQEDSTFELLDPEQFRKFIADDLIDCYTHWIDVHKQVVHFRRCPSQDSDYYLPTEFRLERDDQLKRWKLWDDTLKQFLFSRKSEGYQSLSRAFARLEKEEYVNVAFDEARDAVIVNLPRYHLSFHMRNQRFYSVEYDGFKIASEQTPKDTLIGLQQGLLLDNCSEEDEKVKHVRKQILIVPHGRISIHPGSSEGHQRTSICIEQLRQPPFFVFEFDFVLKRLKADKSKAAWLYLTALHAATSSQIQDPFTEMTGVEVASQILQSGCVWSSSPYDEESLITLKLIKGFSPKRYYYGHGLRAGTRKVVEKRVPEQMETTEWPKGLPSMAAFDGYAIIVNKLLEDSYRLQALHPSTSPRRPDYDFSSDKLRVRAYFKNLNAYNKAVTLKSNYFVTSPEKLNESASLLKCVLRTKNEKSENGKFNLEELQLISQSRFLNVLQEANAARRKSGLSSYLLTESRLQAPQPLLSHDMGILKQVLHFEFRQDWLKFYQMATLWKGPQTKNAFSLVLSTLAYQGAPVEQLLNLHNISVLAETLEFPVIPPSLQNFWFDNPSEAELCLDKLKSFLLDRVIRISYEQGEARLKVHQDQLEIQDRMDYVVDQVKELWPCDKIPKKILDEMWQEAKMWSFEDMKKVSNMLATWSRNAKLKKFIESVERILDKFYEHLPKPSNSDYQFATLNLEVAMEIRLESPSEGNLIEAVYGLEINGDLDEAGVIFYSGSAFQESNSEHLIATQREQCLAKIEGYLQRIQKAFTGTSSKNIMWMSGICPRMTPTLMLQYLLQGLKQKNLHSSLLKCLGALAVLWTELKRFDRILNLKLKQGSVDVSSELKSELENSGHDNWSPVDNPEWLILQLELDIMIRPIQVDVARQMMAMPDGGSGVMQLNMGEGKTSVIVPMLCSTLSGKESLCRVTVLHSIFKTNLTILTFAVGGLLNKRVYTFPCRRDMNIDEPCLKNILDTYLECLSLQGVVLTLPEYLLSFRLMAYDKALKGYPDHGLRFMEIENGLRKYVRDVLDESDELLSVKYQLVYTTGTQVPVDGGSLRWTTCQKLLQVVQDIAERFLERKGSTVVEFDKENHQSHPEQFSHFRLLDNNSGLEEFLSLLADEVLNDFKLTERQKQVVKKYFTQERISLENFKSVMSLFKNDATLLDEIRIFSGYFRRGILALALSKRWRVEYGVDPSGNYCAMAVPFRAKDFAAERTEFGHPDLAIILTQLSYYYSGLSETQLQECFEVLKRKPEAAMIYTSWVQKIPPQNVYKFLISYDGVNLKDGFQRSRLFEMFAKHKAVIDFWLSHKVFPRESTQFPGKITMTAWDLCGERSKLPISGFSGTNDSSILLPLPISQKDLPQLQNTNDKMEKTLLKSENGNHKGFHMGVTCRQILEEMKKDSLQVLIDAGALMLECDNEQVAQLWLETDPGIEAVVYFNKNDEILVKVRSDHGGDTKKKSQGLDLPLELSPYRDRLEKCGVFLDDQHTRGTDLKFPIGSKACVTIGSRMRRDKLMQSCMRMRHLGQGHSVTFYLSHEASSKVLAFRRKGIKGKKRKSKSQQGPCEDAEAISTQDVISWVTQNTKEYNEEGLLYWALSGKNYAQKLIALDFHDSVDSDPLEKIFTLANQCVDEEVLQLKDTYGAHTEPELLSKLIPEWFENTQRKLLSVDGCYSLSQRISKRCDSLRDAIQARCLEHIPEKTHLTGMMLEEEQEKELEQEREAEVEEERQLIRPTGTEEAEPSLHEAVKKVVIHGGNLEVKPGAITRLCDVFEMTSFWKLVQPECWGAAVFATQDFVSVIKQSGDNDDQSLKTDSYLRPIEFLVSFKLPNGSVQVLVLSPYEANELLPFFRKGKALTQLHMFSPRRFGNQDCLLNCVNLQVPRPRCRPPVSIPDDCKALAALFLASGNLYFGSMEEQKGFARFLGLVPRPWSSEQGSAFEKEMIRKSGFLLPKFRKQQKDHCHIDLDAFQKDPISLVKKILMCRHYSVISEIAHVSRLLNHNWYVDLTEGQ